MGLLDSLSGLFKKSSDMLATSGTKVGAMLDTVSTKVMDTIPGGKELGEKASHLTEKAVNRVGQEGKELIAQGQEFLDKHKKKNDTGTMVGDTASPSTIIGPTTTTHSGNQPTQEAEKQSPQVDDTTSNGSSEGHSGDSGDAGSD